MAALFLGSDHAGYEMKEQLKAHLDAEGVAYEDLGCYNTDSVDYPDFGAAVGRAVVAGGEDARGILICGTGIGISIAANKIDGIRAALCRTEFDAEMCRKHNNANVLCLGARTTSQSVASVLVDRFLNEAFEGGRHGRRVDKMNAL